MQNSFDWELRMTNHYLVYNYMDHGRIVSQLHRAVNCS